MSKIASYEIAVFMAQELNIDKRLTRRQRENWIRRTAEEIEKTWRKNRE